MTQSSTAKAFKPVFNASAFFVLLSGCTEFSVPDWASLDGLLTQESTEAASQPDAPIPVSGASSAEQLDASTASERSAATANTSAGQRLGTTVATLGTPAEQGFWLKTPLTDTEMKGVLRSRDTGKRVSVNLIPIDGPPTAGSRISLSAMRALDLPLTALAEIDVSQAG